MPRVNSGGGTAGGFTHSRRIDYNDLIDNTLANTKQSFKYWIPIPQGAIVKDVCLHVNKNLSGGGVTSVVAYVGDSSAYGFLKADASIFIGNNPALDGVTYSNSGAYFTGTDSAGATTLNTLNGKLYNAENAIGMLVVSNADISALTSGEVTLCANILDPSSYK